MTHPADMVQYPRRRDIRTGSADPVPPTGMIPIVPLVAAPSGDPLPTRKELRTGMIPSVLPAGQGPGAAGPAAPAGSTRQRRPRRAARAWLWMVPAAAVAAVLLWLQFGSR
ncbi:hypothetical protein [Arthrobacter mobilis]|uniref:Uncharacterized protein n=1 Tax=Arthrobacter mobilis TaxID=2724944 RepID=A0A7X6K2L6_9MICC|nr:hypothetical protein [Arthrobacter mobilis]NKX53332.1 hypothetical protein [Arthrobacter mobilis]